MYHNKLHNDSYNREHMRELTYELDKDGTHEHAHKHIQAHMQAHNEHTQEDNGHTHTHIHAHSDYSQDICVSMVPIFNHLEKDQLVEIMEAKKTVSFKKGEILYRSGSQSDSLYIVNKGKIKIFRLSESGKEQLLRILQVGDFTGELALFSEYIHEAYAEAMVDSEVCIVKRVDLQELLLKYPSISLKLLSELSNRLEQSEKQTTRFATEKVETRIAHFLAECIDSRDHIKEFILPMSKKDLASYLGTTPETISRKLYELVEAGLIRQKTNKKIEILDLDRLLLV